MYMSRVELNVTLLFVVALGWIDHATVVSSVSTVNEMLVATDADARSPLPK